MKTYNSSYLSTVLHNLKKTLFWGQIIIISMALPTLYYVGVTYNTDKEKHLIMTNKGKKTIVSEEKAGNSNTIKLVRTI